MKECQDLIQLLLILQKIKVYILAIHHASSKTDFSQNMHKMLKVDYFQMEALKLMLKLLKIKEILRTSSSIWLI